MRHRRNWRAVPRWALLAVQIVLLLVVRACHSSLSEFTGLCLLRNDHQRLLDSLVALNDDHLRGHIARRAMSGQPSLTVCLVTRITPNIVRYAAFSHFIQSIYAAMHYGYLMIPLAADSSRDDYQFHRKLSIIHDVLLNDTLGCDYVLWMDADLIPIDLQSWTMTGLIANANCQSAKMNNSRHLWISRDVSSTVNTGSMLWANSRWSKSFLLKWISMHQNVSVLNEQMGFDALIANAFAHQLPSQVCVLGPQEMNSVLPAMSTLQSTDAVLHLAAEEANYRELVFQNAMINLCDHLIIPSAPVGSNLLVETKTKSSQLGLTRRALLQWALESYEDLMETLQRTAPDGTGSPSIVSSTNDLLSWMSAFRLVSGKLGHIYKCVVCPVSEDADEGIDCAYGECDQSLSWRWSAYQQLQAICRCLWDLHHRYTTSDDRNHSLCSSLPLLPGDELLSALPEVLKLTAELNFEFVVHVHSACPQLHSKWQSQQSQAINELRQLLWQLRSVVHDTQQFIVDAMIADLQRISHPTAQESDSV